MIEEPLSKTSIWLKLDCIIKGIWRTFRSFVKTGGTTKIGGCDYKEEEVIENATVTILRCENCKSYSIGWSKNKPKKN